MLHFARNFAAAFFCAVLAHAPQAHAAIQFNTLALSGAEGTSLGFGPQLGAGVDFTFIDGAVLNEAGQVAFSASIEGAEVDLTNDLGIWSTTNGQLHLVAREGSVGPGPNVGGDAIFSNLVGTTVLLDDAGKVVFSGSISGAGISSSNNRGIWSNAGGSLAALARIGPEGPGPNVEPGTNFFSLSAHRLKADGKVAFHAILSSGVTGGLWTNSNGALAPIARQGQAPGPNVGTDIQFVNLSFQVQFNRTGTMLFQSRLTGPGVNSSNDAGIWIHSGGTNTAIARKGSESLGPNMGAGITFTNLAAVQTALSDNNRVAFTGFIGGPGVNTTNDTGLWSNVSGSLALVAREGVEEYGPNLGPGVTFGQFMQTVPMTNINSAGDIVFSAKVAGTGITTENDDGIWLSRNGTLTAIAREGSDGPGPNLGPGVIFSGLNFLVSSHRIDSSGAIVFTADIDGPEITGETDAGAWLWSNGQMKPIVVEGDTIDVDPSSTGELLKTVSEILLLGDGQTGGPRALNDHGLLAVQLGFTDFSEGIFTVLLRELGDFNLDGVVNTADLPEMLRALSDLNAYRNKYGLSEDQLLAIVDINQDFDPITGSGGFNNQDIQPFLNLLQAGGSLSAVPEPASLGLALFAFAAVLQRATRRRRIATVANLVEWRAWKKIQRHRGL